MVKYPDFTTFRYKYQVLCRFKAVVELALRVPSPGRVLSVLLDKTVFRVLYIGSMDVKYLISYGLWSTLVAFSDMADIGATFDPP